jgi:hypothetical protein
MHEGKQPNGSYAEYGVSWAYTTIHLPEHTTFRGKQTVSYAYTCGVG